MNRELKFRQPVFDSKGNFVSFYYWGYLDGDDTFTPPIHGESDQFTRLRDKHNKEVYEKDIMAVDYYSRHHKQFIIIDRLPVEYRHDKYVLAQDETESLNLEFMLDKEVIGNIWQNPELLKAGN